MLKALGGFAGGSGNAAVISVNGQTGVVVLDAADVGAASNNVNIIAGTGLGGGGNLEANVTVFLANTAVSAGSYGGNTNVAVFTVDNQGRITSASNVAIASGGVGTVTNVDTGTDLTGGPITSSGTISLANTTVTAGTYGDANNVAQIVVDSQGRITAASNVAITAVSGFATVDQAIAFAVALG